jgi:hypothetical protein
MDQSTENDVTPINIVLQNEFFRTFLLLLTGVLIGYTLQPVPRWLSSLMDKSHLFKFMILWIVGLVTLYPINKKKLIEITLGSIAVLVVFQLLRQF